MPSEYSRTQPIVVSGISNREFLERYAEAGRVGLCNGATLIDRAICRAQRRLDRKDECGAWSHVFLFQGKRADGHHWVIESDLQMHRKHFQFGVQENRISKYFNEDLYRSLAVLDFGLSATQVADLLSEAIDLAANRARYSLRELVGTLLALRHTELRNRENLLAREKSMYCSAFVQWVFRKAGLDLAPGLDFKNTTPKDIAGTALPHTAYWLMREMPVRKTHFPRLKLRPRRAE
ncbi:MAG TPA: hypothetical protein VKY92_11830 [Verrucomicrobiae bacterium]|nr:hypothetical protein [Verrucomicrobiae bacterium]